MHGVQVCSWVSAFDNPLESPPRASSDTSDFSMVKCRLYPSSANFPPGLATIAEITKPTGP